MKTKPRILLTVAFVTLIILVYVFKAQIDSFGEISDFLAGLLTGAALAILLPVFKRKNVL